MATSSALREAQRITSYVTDFDRETQSSVQAGEKPDLPGVGVRYLPVNGMAVVDQGTIVANVAPGKVLLGPSGL
jgi:hypothetical protein